MAKPRYSIELEVIEGLEDSGCDHRPGEKFEYPKDIGKLCPFLLDSMSGMLRVLEFGGTLPWTFPGTEYEKEIDADGVTTEYVRCPDPTATGIVVKITRRRVIEKS
jgi:uncharacterized repeat protein (TIGR04076 family)